MRDHVREISYKTVEGLVNITDNFNMYEGTLQDNYIFYNTDKIKVGRANPRDYIIIKSEYKNEWSSKLVMIMTNRTELVEEHRQMWES